MDLTFGSHTSFDAGRSLDPDGFGTLGLDSWIQPTKEVYLEEPNPQEMDEPRPFREETSLGLGLTQPL